MSAAGSTDRPADLLVQGQVTHREGEGTFFVTLRDGLPDAD